MFFLVLVYMKKRRVYESLRDRHLVVPSPRGKGRVAADLKTKEFLWWNLGIDVSRVNDAYAALRRWIPKERLTLAEMRVLNSKAVLMSFLSSRRVGGLLKGGRLLEIEPGKNIGHLESLQHRGLEICTIEREPPEGLEKVAKNETRGLKEAHPGVKFDVVYSGKPPAEGRTGFLNAVAAKTKPNGWLVLDLSEAKEGISREELEKAGFNLVTDTADEFKPMGERRIRITQRILIAKRKWHK